MIRLLIALAAVVATIAAGTESGAGAQPPAATTSAAPKPPIHKMLIPYPKKRKREMAAYSQAPLRPVQVAPQQPQDDRHPLRRGRQHQRDLQHLPDRSARRRVP